MKNLSFDATEVTTKTRSSNCFSVEVETNFLDEVLDNFTAHEIIQNYSDLDGLYIAMKEVFEDY